MRRQEPFAPFGVTKASQLVTKSDQWFSDALLLHRHGRFAAALYVGGFVLECLLKAALWSRRFEPQVRDLLFSHDLGSLLEMNGPLDRALQESQAGLYDDFIQWTSWTVRFRYNPRRVGASEADAFMWRLREVRSWLRSRL